MMRIVLDQGLPRGTASHLRREGWDVVHVGEIGMNRATDQEILDYARRENRFALRWMPIFMPYWFWGLNDHRQWCAFGLKVCRR